jgi:membrane protein required for colicin V production
MISTIQWLHLNGIDYTILAILLISLLIGLFRGFICELTSLITWVAAFLIAYKFSFTIIFVIVLIIGISINLMVRHLLYPTGIPVMDRILGLLFGIARGIFIVAVILLFVRASALQTEPAIKQAQLIPPFTPVVNWLQNILPNRIAHISEWSHPQKKTPPQNEETDQHNHP